MQVSWYPQNIFATRSFSTLAKLDDEQFRLSTITQWLGLSHIRGTYLGHGQIRGVSREQRRLVTTGEMLMWNASIICTDEISTGLDAASTYSTMHKLSLLANFLGHTRVISLPQPSPQSFALFDEVIVLAQSYVIYVGPVAKVLPYFTNLGHTKPEQLDVADFLQLIGTTDGHLFNKRHLTPLYLAHAFRDSVEYDRIKVRFFRCIWQCIFWGDSHKSATNPLEQYFFSDIIFPSTTCVSSADFIKITMVEQQ
mmetsp:Transcript_22878/g.33230  ORF Transcript_22878/g.33230 Transcript_22878/m.33230 type:complete len:253 (-) Transcript_22878:1523-2281(-)